MKRKRNRTIEWERNNGSCAGGDPSVEGVNGAGTIEVYRGALESIN
jgi:hypothetical protein